MEKIKANRGSWNTVILKKLVYLVVRTSEVFLCFGVTDFLLYFVWWLLFTFFTCMLLVRLAGFCTKDECKNLWLNCCVNCLNCKAQGKPLLSQYDPKWLPCDDILRPANPWQEKIWRPGNSAWNWGSVNPAQLKRCIKLLAEAWELGKTVYTTDKCYCTGQNVIVKCSALLVY